MKMKMLFSLVIMMTASVCFSQGFFQKLKQEIKTNSQVNANGQNSTNAVNQYGVQQQWTKISFGNQMPQDAVVGGRDEDGKPLIVARGNYFGAVHPGKTRREWDAVHFEYGGKEQTWADYEVLVGGGGLDWVTVNGGSIPANAVVGGQETQRTLYVCRCEYQGSTQIGKTWQGYTNCNIGFGGNGIIVPNYQLLVQTNASVTGNYQPGGAAQQVNGSYQPLATTAVPVQHSSLKAYGNYDFVPGETILFEDNFAGEQNGEFPSKWDLEKGQAMLDQVNNEAAFFITQGNYAYVVPRLTTKSYLTDPFTVEVDYYVQNDHRNGVSIFLECSDGERIVKFSENGEVSSSYFPRDFSNPFPGEGVDFFNKWHHAALIFKNGQMKCYVDQYRVLIMPNTQITPVSVKFGGIGSQDNPMIFRNVKIAAGGSMNLIGKKFTDAKIVTHGIKFEVGLATIKAESMGTLNMIKEVMKENPEIKFEIDGHTDSDGDPTSNQKLSQDRAEAVKAALIDLGIDASRLTTKGYGSSKPISDNNSTEGKANNRRVEFIRF